VVILVLLRVVLQVAQYEALLTVHHYKPHEMMERFWYDVVLPGLSVSDEGR
jgi:hypothetical protein